MRFAHQTVLHLLDGHGIFPAVTSKLTQDGKIDIEQTKVSIDRLVKLGISGIIVLPMLGENASINLEERKAVIHTVVKVVNGGVPVLSGLAEIALYNAKRNAKLYERLGAQGLMVFPSLGYTTDNCETVEWYKSIESASSLPDMIYTNPILRRRLYRRGTQGPGRRAGNRLY